MFKDLTPGLHNPSQFILLNYYYLYHPSSGEGKEHLIVARGGKSKLSMRSPLIHFWWGVEVGKLIMGQQSDLTWLSDLAFSDNTLVGCYRTLLLPAYCGILSQLLSICC